MTAILLNEERKVTARRELTALSGFSGPREEPHVVLSHTVGRGIERFEDAATDA